MGGVQERVCQYERPATYGQYANGNPCAGCGRPEAAHLTAYRVPLAEGMYLVVHAHSVANAGDIAGRKGYAAVAPISEATEMDTTPVKTLRPWS
jgi:hypothetical protein